MFGRLLDWTAVLVIIILAVYGLSLTADSKVKPSTDIYRPAADYTKAVEETANDLRYRNKLTFDENALAGELKKRFPEINSVAADLSVFSRTPNLYITIAEPSMVFEGTEGTFGAGLRMVIDSKGTVVGPLSDFPAIKNLPVVYDATGFGARKGEAALSRSDVDFILTVIAQAKKAKVPIKSLTFPRSARELDLRTTDRPYFVKFHLGGDPLVQSGQFLAARQRFDQTKKQPDKYLDVRVAGKVYFK